MADVTPETWARIEAVSWDVDGTLFRNADFHRALRQRALRRLARMEIGETWRGWQTVKHHQRFAAEVRAREGVIAPSENFWTSPEWEELVSDWIVPSLESIGPRPDLLPLLDAIAASGRRQVVTSDFHSALKLEALGLDDRFDTLFAGQDLGFIKPARELFQHVLETLEMAPDRVLHIGDRPDTDGSGAEKVGMPCVIVGPDLAPVAALIGTQG